MTQMNRRAVLAAGGVVAAGGVLVACSSGSDLNVDGAATPTEENTTDQPAVSDVSSLVAVADIPVGGGVVIENPPIVITQPEAGTIQAFTAICPHQGCLVSEVVDNEIICPCHQSLFSAIDGAVIAGPADQALGAASVTVANGEVSLA
ncbi:MAG: Rieske (2Fe-2S) protein [Candidatus Nanopelagicales bacterium]|jgi:nitrite reductase/ring-hydroxylating ferredoxin subunit|nr:Rieske (2Fe-2S) protein [Candidatus Nanopelagicales bacterium]